MSPTAATIQQVNECIFGFILLIPVRVCLSRNNAVRYPLAEPNGPPLTNRIPSNVAGTRRVPFAGYSTREPAQDFGTLEYREDIADPFVIV